MVDLLVWFTVKKEGKSANVFKQNIQYKFFWLLIQNVTPFWVGIWNLTFTPAGCSRFQLPSNLGPWLSHFLPNLGRMSLFSTINSGWLGHFPSNLSSMYPIGIFPVEIRLKQKNYLVWVLFCPKSWSWLENLSYSLRDNVQFTLKWDYKFK